VFRNLKWGNTQRQHGDELSYFFSFWKKGRLKGGMCESKMSDLEADSETANILYSCGGVIKYLGMVTF
jgi:hypothetical protein